MKKLSKKEVLAIILNASKEYEAKLRDKHFLIVYQNDKEYKTACVGFRDMNFLHMTGVNTKFSASQFYKACIDQMLSEKDFEIDTYGKVQQKIAVLPYLSELLYNNCMIGDFIDSGIYIRADYFVGNTKAILSVGFRTGKSVDYPVTLYNEDIRKLSNPTCKVLAVFMKAYNDKEYSKCTYLSKGQPMNKLPFSETVKKLIKIEDSVCEMVIPL